MYCVELHRAAPDRIVLLTVGARGGDETPAGRVRRALRDAERFGRTLVTLRPRIVQLNPSLDAHAAVRDGLNMAVARACRVKPIVFLHGWPPESSRWISAHGRRIAQVLLNGSAGVVVLSEAYRRSLREWGVTVPIHVESTLVPRDVLVSLATITRPRRDACDEPLSVLVLGRLTARKGVWTAVEAVARARAAGSDVRLVFAGDGPELRPLAEWPAGRPAEWITCLGEVRGREKLEALARVDGMLMPSPSEGMPLSLLEGMAAGLPVVTTRVGGIVDFFVEGEMGYSCPPDDPQALAEALARLAVSAEERLSMGAHNREFALRHFDPDVVWRRLENIYGAVSEGSRGPRQERDPKAWCDATRRCETAMKTAPVCAHGRRTDWVAAAAVEQLARLFSDDFRGYDPYDGMNARGAARFAGDSLLAQRVLTQIVKRTPVHVQPLLGVPPTVSATTIGYAMLACARLHRASELPTGWDGRIPRMVEIVDRLAAVNTESELAWGSHVDVATRFGFTPSAMPNVVVTACVAHGLAALTEEGLADQRDALGRIAGFIVRRLARDECGGSRWFAYTPDGETMVHNGSMLAAATLVRCGAALGDEALVAAGVSGALTTVAYQRGNGAWPYAEHAAGRWDDSFHTGFILEGLCEAMPHEPTGVLRKALLTGSEHYVRTFFGARGEPWYSAERRYPLDAMAAAQALDVLPRLAALVPEAAPLCARVAEWVDRDMLRSGGRVAYQIHRGWTDLRQFPRWSVAPMAAALSGLCDDRVRFGGEDAAEEM